MAYEFIARNGLIAQNNSTVTGSLTVTGGITGSLQGTSSWASNAITASYVTGSIFTNANSAASASYAATASRVNQLNQTVTISGSLVLTGSLATNDGVNVQTITASVVSSSQFTGSLFGTASYVTGSIFTNSNSAASASYAVTASYVNPLNQNVIITGSLRVSGSLTEIGTTTVSGSLTISGSFTTNDGVNVQTITASIVSASQFTGSLFGTASWASNAITASYIVTAQTASYVVTAQTASSVNTLNQNVLITGSLTVGTGSIGSGENTLILGIPPNGGTGEGGQILLQAPGGTYTSASMWDNYQNSTRLLRGTNSSSDAIVAQFNMHTKQVQFPQYNTANSFTGTSVASLGVDSSGNILTVGTLAIANGGTNASTTTTARNNTGANKIIDAYTALGSSTKSYVLGLPINRLINNQNYNLGTGIVHFHALEMMEGGLTLTGIQWVQIQQGNYIANNNNKVGLYSYSGGTLTLVASSTNDGNIWKAAAGTLGSKAFSSTYTTVAGTLYFASLIYSTSAQTTQPWLYGTPAFTQAPVMTNDYTNSAKTSAFITGQTDLPATQAMSGLSIQAALVYLGVY